jgi:membrane protein implicated in regulation of membrane protease activity
MEQYMPYIWLGVIIVMAVVEAASVQLISIWFVIGGIAALIASLITESIVIQLTVFILVTALMLVVTRPLVKKVMRFKKEDTNAGRYIGKVGTVILCIDNELGQGQVNVQGSIWTARSTDGSVIPKGANVAVERIEGVKLLVSVIPNQKEEEQV